LRRSSRETNLVRVLEAIGRFKGKRFVIASETNDSTRLDAALIKRLTGGNKLIGTNLGRSAFDFDPTHTIWLACNHLPAIKDASVAMWERVKTIPFGRNFIGEEQNKNLKDELKSEANGIFTWLVEGANKYLSDSIDNNDDNTFHNEPDVCKLRTIEYKNVNDALSFFIRDCLISDKIDKDGIGSHELLDKYNLWRVTNDGEYISKNNFPAKMEERLGLRKRTGDGMRFVGWRIRQ
jgi:putative DNA primase/helicase